MLVKSKREVNEDSWYESIKSRLCAVVSGSGADAKAVLTRESAVKARSKTRFFT